MICSRVLLTALLAAMVSGCAVGPEYVRPLSPEAKGYDEAPLPATTVETDGEGSQSFTMGADIPGAWWTLFHSEELDRLVAEALKDNPDLKAALASLNMARENAGVGEAQLFPSLSAAFSSEREKTSSASDGGLAPGTIFTLHNASVSVSYGLDVFGTTRRTIEDLDAKTEFQKFQLEAAILTVTSNIVTGALDEASLGAQIKATHNIIDDQEHQLEILKQQLALGGASPAAVLAEESALQQTRAGLPLLEKQLAQTRHQLSILIGQTPENAPWGEFNFERIQLPAHLPVSLPVKLIEQRPDIRAAEANLHAASAEIGIAVANRLPGISLTGNIGSQANQFSQLFLPGGGIWALSGSVAETIFDAGALAHKQGAAEAGYALALEQYRKAILVSFGDVADVLQALQADAVALKAQDAANRAAEQSLELTKNQLAAGAVSYLALLDAEQAEQQTKISLIKARAQRFVDTAALFQALGGGWWNRSSPREIEQSRMELQTKDSTSSPSVVTSNLRLNQPVSEKP